MSETPEQKSARRAEQIAKIQAAKAARTSAVKTKQTQDAVASALGASSQNAVAQLADRIERNLKGRQGLRRVQKLGAEAVVKFLREGKTDAAVVLPTGSGKTRLFGEILAATGLSGLVLVPNIALVAGTVGDTPDPQTGKRPGLGALKEDGVFGAGTEIIGLSSEDGTGNSGARVRQALARSEGKTRVIVTTYQTLLALGSNSPETFRALCDAVQVVVRDEAHRSIGAATQETVSNVVGRQGSGEEGLADEIRDVLGLPADAPLDAQTARRGLDALEKENAATDKVSALGGRKIQLLFTATPDLLDKSVGDKYPTALRVRLEDVAKDGDILLPRIRLVGAAFANVANDASFGTDAQLRKRTVFRDERGVPVAIGLTDAYLDEKAKAPGAKLPAVAFCNRMSSAETYAQYLRSRGLRAQRVTSAKGDISPDEAKRLLDAGELDVMVTVSKVSEGWDVPALRCAIWFEPTASNAKLTQRNGRILRTCVGHPVFADKTADGTVIIEPKEWHVQAYDPKDLTTEKIAKSDLNDGQAADDGLLRDLTAGETAEKRGETRSGASPRRQMVLGNSLQRLYDAGELSGNAIAQRYGDAAEVKLAPVKLGADRRGVDPETGERWCAADLPVTVEDVRVSGKVAEAIFRQLPHEWQHENYRSRGGEISGKPAAIVRESAKADALAERLFHKGVLEIDGVKYEVFNIEKHASVDLPHAAFDERGNLLDLARTDNRRNALTGPKHTETASRAAPPENSENRAARISARLHDVEYCQFILQKPDLSEAELRILAGSPSAFVRSKVTEHKKTTRSVLECLSGDQNEKVRQAANLAKRGLGIASSDSAETREALLAMRYGQVANYLRHAPNATREAFESLTKHVDARVRIMVAEHDGVPVETLETLARDPVADVRTAVARNDNASAEALETLAKNEPEGAHVWVALHPNATPETLKTLAKDGALSARKALVRSENATPEMLEILSKDEDPEVRESAAAHENATPETLLALARDEEPRVRVNVAKHRCATREILQALVEDKDSRVRENVAIHPCATREILQALAKDTNPCVRVNVAQHRCATPEILRTLAKDANEHVRAMVAYHAHTSADDLGALAQDGSADAQIMVAKNRNATPEILKILAKDGAIAVRRGLARNENAAPEVLGVLAKDEDREVRVEVVDHPNATSEILLTMAKDEDWVIRLRTGDHPNTTLDILWTLAKDEVGSVRQMAAIHPRATPDILAALANDTDSDVLVAIAEHANASPETLKTLAGNRYVKVRLAVAASQCAPEDLLATLARDQGEAVRAAVARNPRSTPEILARLATDKHPKVLRALRLRRGDDAEDSAAVDDETG